MPSPFPGMDPFLETRTLWESFHNHLIYHIDVALARVLPRGYTIDIASRTYVVVEDPERKEENLPNPDVTVTRSRPSKKPRKKGGVVVAEADPATAGSVPMRAFLAEKFRDTFVEIYAEYEERVLVTCIEVLSPSNKRQGTEGWKEYVRKRQAMLLGQANFIEIDLLRGGHKMPMLDPWPESPYSLLVCRSFDTPHCRVWPASFQDRLPVIPVPLGYLDPDLTLDLQPLLDDVYTVGRYDERIDYTKPLTPALTDAEAAWVRDHRLASYAPRPTT